MSSGGWELAVVVVVAAEGVKGKGKKGKGDAVGKEKTKEIYSKAEQQ